MNAAERRLIIEATLTVLGKHVDALALCSVIVTDSGLDMVIFEPRDQDQRSVNVLRALARDLRECADQCDAFADERSAPNS
jgi:hypothetical protein